MEESMSILWQGARGAAVEALQERLKTLGYDPGGVDGLFGPDTNAAVTAFQRDRKVFPDGIVGPQTFSALNLPAAAPEAPGTTRSKVFVSYAREDEKWLEMLQVHLAPLERTGVVERWDDTKIAPGSEWRAEIDGALRSAKVAVLLVSPYFMASEFIANKELPALLEAAEHEGAVILPVIISPCVMGSLSEFQAVNSPSRALVDLGRGDRDRVWVQVVTAITAALND
jgi:hypothetical protein